MPSILIYWGDVIENRRLTLPESASEFWRKTRSQYHEPAVAKTAAFARLCRFADLGEIQKNTFRRPAGRGQQFSDQFRGFDLIAGLLQCFANRRLFGSLRRPDHAGHHLGDPAILDSGIVAAAADQGRH